MPAITLHAVADRSELRHFLDVPFQLHHREPSWVPDIRSDLVARTRFTRNPFWRRADGRLFIARSGRDLVGRISVQIDRAEGGDPTTAVFGWFEAADDQAAVDALLGAAAHWAAEQGAARLVGPMSFTAWEQAGLLVTGHDRVPVFPAAWNPPRYGAALERARYVGAWDAVALQLDTDGAGPEGGTRRSSYRDLEAGVLAHGGDLSAMLPAGPGVWRPSRAEMRARLRRLRPYLDPHVSHAGDGAVLVAVTDVAELMTTVKHGGGPVAAARALRGARRRSRVAALPVVAGADDLGSLLARARWAAAGRGYEAVEAVVGDGTPLAHVLRSAGAREVRRYRVYGRPLDVAVRPPGREAAA